MIFDRYHVIYLYTINIIFTTQELLLKARSRTLYHAYTASIIAALGMSVISIINLNNSPAILPSAAFAAQQQKEQKFTAKMTGSEEVPPRNTRARGTAEFILDAGGKTLSYKVSVNDIHGVTIANINNGTKGQNGPVVVTLFRSRIGNPILGFISQNIPTNGVLSEGTITSSNLQGPLKGKQVSELVNLMKSGQAYTNVRTKQNPRGEIRGQIS